MASLDTAYSMEHLRTLITTRPSFMVKKGQVLKVLISAA